MSIANSVGLADSIILYSSLLDDVRRLVLQKDTREIYITKSEATTWLEGKTDTAKRLGLILASGADLTEQDKNRLKTFLSDVQFGGNKLRETLISMRQKPLDEIWKLDTEFDKIRADLTTASNALKNGKPDEAKPRLVSAISRLEKYKGIDPRPIPGGLSPDNAPPFTTQEEANEKRRQRKEQEAAALREPTPMPASNLPELLQTVLDMLNAAPPRKSEQHHSIYASGLNPIMVEPAMQTGINAVLRAKLKPASWLQVGIGYAVTFPILLRVSEKNNRIKLLNDALRLVPPGLRHPMLGELANDLANLP